MVELVYKFDEKSSREYLNRSLRLPRLLASLFAATSNLGSSHHILA